MRHRRRLLKKYPVKVLLFPGASADDMHYLRSLIQKCSNTFILHVGTNNCVSESSGVVLDKISNVKIFILNSLPQSKIIIFNIIAELIMAKRFIWLKT